MMDRTNAHEGIMMLAERQRVTDHPFSSLMATDDAPTYTGAKSKPRHAATKKAQHCGSET